MSNERQIYNLFGTPFFIFNLKKSHKKINASLKRLAYQVNKFEGVKKSNRSGYQSDFLKDKLLEDLIKSTQKYFTEFAEEIGLLKPWSCNNHLPWININKKESFNALHTHGGEDFSLIYYIQVPQNSGAIVFETPVLHLRTSELKYNNQPFFNSPEIRYVPKKYDLIIFPSWLAHSVESNKSDEDRISLAWNTKITQ